MCARGRGQYSAVGMGYCVCLRVPLVGIPMCFLSGRRFGFLVRALIECSRVRVLVRRTSS